MGKVTPVQTNFTAGELTPRMRGRVDVARYANGAEIVENAWPVIHGGVERRWGTRFMRGTKVNTKRSRLVPFVFSEEQAYMLEFGDGYMRVFTSAGPVMNGGVPYEVATPYDEGMLQQLDFTQAADTMILWHPARYPRRLRRFLDNRWVIDNLPVDPNPIEEIGSRFTYPLSVTPNVTGVQNVSGGYTKQADIGNQIITPDGGTATITGVVDGAVWKVDVIVPFASSSYPPYTWTVTGSPRSTITVSGTLEVGGAVTITADVDTWRTSDVYIFRPFVELNGGLVQLTSINGVDPLKVHGKVLRKINTNAAAPPYSWTMKGPVWNDWDGYPCTGTFFQQRLIAGGSPGYPQTIWGSATGYAYDFLFGTEDDAAFTFTIASDDVNPIRYICAMEAIVVLTYGGEFTIEGGVEKPITPTNFKVKPRTNYGAANVRPVRVGAEEVFVQKPGRRVRAIGYNDDLGKWAAPDMSVLAEHLLRPGVVSLSWHDDPQTLIFAVRKDGVLATCTFDRDQDVAGWARQTTDGAFESVATIPGADGAETWAIVRRTIGGATVRYVEKFDPAVMRDSCITGENPGGANVWTGLGHLEGKEVDIMADGAVMPRQIVTGGQVTLPRLARSVEIGLPYVSRVKTLPPEVAGPMGSSQGSANDMGDVHVRLLDTIGCAVNGQPLPFRNFGTGMLNQRVEPYSGIKKVENLSWAEEEEGGTQVELTQEQGLIWHVLSVIRKWTTNQG
ncbi:hypothetical protein [Eleftheria terrae]|uniref:hypothetical protein n=1 Tax=Eleftheria terrae TaxID=1597781 RepID=UPI00263B58FF|nr:hypothetical protein [Eleftheria terrae]WKB53020.1 hypothetical protein N7L95_01035 [Eleftheria terrae]